MERELFALLIESLTRAVLDALRVPVEAERPAAYNPTMRMDASSTRPNAACRVLAVSLALGMVLALVAAAFAPALPGSAAVVRVGALAFGAICVVGLVVLGRPRG